MSSKADRKPGPGKTECPNCPGAFFKSVSAHQVMARCGELASGQTAAPAEQLTLEGKPMAECIHCALKDRDLVDRDKEIAQLKEKTPEVKAPNLKTALEHAQKGGCPECVAELKTFTQDLVGKVMTELSDDALRGLAIERGVIPSEINIEVPHEAVHG